jgi:hypothetical protein
LLTLARKMKTKRLQHHADILCKMFCGWQLLHDYKLLTELGHGTLEIDALARTSTHNGAPVTLNMADVLGMWLSNDIQTSAMSLNTIISAIIRIEFTTERHRGQRNKSMQWARPTKEFISCSLKCVSSIKTAEREYTSQYEETEEWPTNYGQ